MKEFRLGPDQAESSLVREITSRLLSGEVGILPTETVYGLMCLATHQPGRERIYAMKQRDHGKPLQFLIGSVADLALLDIIPTNAFIRLAHKFWPGPLTVVIGNLNQQNLGVRIPAHPFMLAVLKKLNKPLLATSANRSGNNPATSAGDHFQDLLESPDFCVLSDEIKGMASTVIHLKDDSFEILRSGPIIHQELATALISETEK